MRSIPDKERGQTVCTRLDSSAALQSPEARCNEEQATLPPRFTANRHRPPIPPLRPQGPRPAWMLDLEVTCDELAETNNQGDDTVMPVEVWYVHHANCPECRAPRIVELEAIQDLWYMLTFALPG